MGCPILRIHGDEGEHVDGSLEHVEVPVASQVVKAVSGVAALHILTEGFPVAVGAAFVGVPGDALLVRPHKDTVVVLAVLDERFCPCEVGYDLAVDVTLFDQIGKDAPHIRIRLRQREGLPGRFLPVGDGRVCLPLLTVQQQADRLRIAEIVKPLDKADCPAALTAGMIEPLAATHSNAVVPLQALVMPRG